MLIQKYCRYDTAGLLRGLEDAKTTLKNLESQYKELDGVGSMDYSKDKVTGSVNTDMLENTAIRRADLRSKIDGYRHDIKIVEGSIDKLSDDEKTAIKALFFEHKSVNQVCRILALEQSAVYNLRRRALKHLEQLIFG